MSAKNGQTSLTQRVYSRLRDDILNAKLQPGMPLSRRKLAEEFGVSTLPVAQSLQRLEAEGFVESRPQAGTRVKIPSAAEIRGTYIVREALETQAARLFAQEATAAQKKLLVRMAARLDASFTAVGARRDPGNRKHAATERDHVAFHIFLAGASGCPELQQAIERSRVLLFNWLFMSSGQIGPLPPRWHAELAEVLSGGGADAAGEAMRRHVRYRMEEVIGKFEGIASGIQAGRIVRGPQRRSVRKGS